MKNDYSQKCETIRKYLRKWEGGKTWKDYLSKLKDTRKINLTIAEVHPILSVVYMQETTKRRINKDTIQRILNQKPDLIKNTMPFRNTFYAIACTNKKVHAITTITTRELIELIRDLYKQ